MPPFRARAGNPMGGDVNSKLAELEAVLDGGGRRSERADSEIMTDRSNLTSHFG
jgi:hypothetical protein